MNDLVEKLVEEMKRVVLQGLSHNAANGVRELVELIEPSVRDAQSYVLELDRMIIASRLGASAADIYQEAMTKLAPENFAEGSQEALRLALRRIESHAKREREELTPGPSAAKAILLTL